MFARAQERQSQFPLKSMLAWCRTWFKRSFESDFGCCCEAEIERMARDIRMSAPELRAVARKGPRAADLLLRRMADLDLDPKEVARVEPAAFRDCGWDAAAPVCRVLRLSYRFRRHPQPHSHSPRPRRSTLHFRTTVIAIDRRLSSPIDGQTVRACIATE